LGKLYRIPSIFSEEVLLRAENRFSSVSHDNPKAFHT